MKISKFRAKQKHISFPDLSILVVALNRSTMKLRYTNMWLDSFFSNRAHFVCDFPLSSFSTFNLSCCICPMIVRSLCLSCPRVVARKQVSLLCGFQLPINLFQVSFFHLIFPLILSTLYPFTTCYVFWRKS